ncbi:MAG: right-handed parallel beta-helix repeat-containing protein, partial [bacterium]
MKARILLALCSAPLILYGGAGQATIHNVPSEYSTIQAAITATVDSDTVLVARGIYMENIDFLGKDILVASQYLYDRDSNTVVTTVIDADSNGSVVKMISDESSAAILMGFTLKNGAGSLYQPGYGTFYVGGGVFLIGSSPTIVCNVITQNTAPDGGAGIFSDGGTPSICNNIIVENTTLTASGCGAGMLIKNADGGEIFRNFIQYNHARHGGGIAVFQSSCEITRNVISNNTAIYYGGGIRIYSNAAPVIINNTISHNSGYPNMGGGVEVEGGSAPVFMNNIVSFTASGGGFLTIGMHAVALSYNLFWENTGGNYINIPPGAGDITGDPAYVGGTPFDYHITATSAARD